MTIIAGAGNAKNGYRRRRQTMTNSVHYHVQDVISGSGLKHVKQK
jgi:hypothetical protein